MAAAKSKKVKKVTEIPEANVKIEVEQTEEDAKDTETTQSLVETAKVSEEPEEEAEEKGEVIEKEEKEVEVENFDDGTSSSLSWKKVFLYTFIAAAIGFLILGAFYFIMKNYNFSVSKDGGDKSIQLPSNAPTPTTAEVDRQAYEIEVLNGSGIAGEAASVQTLLEDAGFSVSEIGNAEAADFTDTQILAGEDVDDAFVDELEKALEERGPVEVEEAPSTQTQDVVVIVGSETTKEN